MEERTQQWLSATLVALGSVMGVSAVSAQQPDPFSDYEAGIQQPAEALPASAAMVVTEGPSVPELRTEAGRFSLGVRTMISYSSRSNAQPTGPDAKNRTLFVRGAPMLQWFAMDDLEVGASFGPMLTSLARPDGRSVSEHDWLLEVGAHYYLKLTPRFAMAPGLSVGPYWGSSEQELQVTDADGDRVEVTEETATLGVAGTLYLSAVYQLTEEMQVRSGLALTGMLGRERIQSDSASYGSRGLTLSIPVELYYTF